MILDEEMQNYFRWLAVGRIAVNKRSLFDLCLLEINDEVRKARVESADFCLAKHARQFDNWFLPRKIKYIIAIVLWYGYGENWNFVKYYKVFKSPESMAGLKDYTKWFKRWKKQFPDEEVPDHGKFLKPAGWGDVEPHPGYYNEPRCFGLMFAIWAPHKYFERDVTLYIR